MFSFLIIKGLKIVIIGLFFRNFLKIKKKIDEKFSVDSVSSLYGFTKLASEKLIKELKLESNVLFLKNLSKDEKNSYLKNSNVFVMPSISYKKSVEGFGIVYVEAAQYGVPSIGGKVGGASDAIVDNETGLLCDGNNMDEIYQSLVEILQNNKFKVLGKNAEENAKKFLWQEIIKNYLLILKN